VILLNVICLVVALVAIAFGVIAVLRARGADERATQAAAGAARAEATAQAAAVTLDQFETRLADARQDAAQALDQATRAAQSAAQASAAAAESSREAEAAADKAARAEAQAEVTGAEPAEGDGGESTEQAASVAVAGRATVSRAEDHDVHSGGTGATERVVRVTWRLERVRSSTWALRNTGSTKANDALLSDATLPPKFVRPDEVIPRDVDRDDALQFRVTGGRGAPPPRIRVTWREDDGSPAYSREFTVLAPS
jgi:F0F1-type ATP synthase membrane subunit b/b'